MTPAQQEEAISLVRRLLTLIGDDPNRDGLRDTPLRVVRSWGELYSGYKAEIQPHVRVFESTYDQMVMVQGIDYFSMCEHHMLPFFGNIHIGYIPDGEHKVLGVSKLARIVEVFTRRLQIQEQLTQQIAGAINEAVKPKGVGVIVTGSHLCMMARGVQQQHATMRTSCMLGIFREDNRTRGEFLNLLALDGKR